MKRRQFLKTAGVGVAAAAVASPAIAQSMPEIKWRMTTSWPKLLDTLYGGADMMCKAVGEATDGKFQIQSFAPGEIVPGLQVVDSVQNGTVECGHTASYYYFGKDPTFAFGTSVGFGPNQRLNQGWWTLGGGKEVLNEFYKKYNCTALLAGNTGCGRLVPQGDQHRCRSQGIEIPHRRLPRKGDRQARRGTAADRGGRHLSGAGEGHHRRRRVGRSLTTTRSWASTRSRRTTTILSCRIELRRVHDPPQSGLIARAREEREAAEDCAVQERRAAE
jgi:hypothetical protein